MKRCCATPTYKKQQQQQQRLRCTRSSMHPLPCSPLRVRSAHCFSEAAKLLIKAFAFYIWRTRAHTHTHTNAQTVHTGIPLYISYIHIYIVYGRLPPVRAFWPQSRRKLCNKNASCSSFSASLVTRFAYHATQSRDFSTTTHTSPPIPSSSR